MEKKPKTFGFFDDSNQLVNEQNIFPENLNPSIKDLDQEIKHMSAQNNIQRKYYEQYKRVYQLSYKSWCQKRKLQETYQHLTSRINIIEAKLSNSRKPKRNEQELEIPEKGEKDQKIKTNKRVRRTAEEIQRKYACTVEFCGLRYGSEGSLQQHIKLKHPQLCIKFAQDQKF